MTSVDATGARTPAVPQTGATGYATAPEQLPQLVFEAYNAGDLDRVERLFEPEALLVVAPGQSVTGADRRAALAGLLAHRPRFTGAVRHVYTHGDLALIVGDYVEEIEVDGQLRRNEGTATDVARRGPDGHWRYAIDNPWGTAGPDRG